MHRSALRLAYSAGITGSPLQRDVEAFRVLASRLSMTDRAAVLRLAAMLGSIPRLPSTPPPSGVRARRVRRSAPQARSATASAPVETPG